MALASKWFAAAIIVLLVALKTTAKVIDLSHKHGPNTFPTISGSPLYNFTVLFKGDFAKGVYAEFGHISSSEHAGTHIDAPSHFVKGGRSLDEIPLEDTIADGVMIDCTKEAEADRDYLVPIAKLEGWEQVNGKIPPRAAVLFNFGWSSKFSKEMEYRGTTDFKNISAHHFPAVTTSAALWLMDDRDAIILGTDAMSPDPFQENGKQGNFSIHRMWLPKNRLIVENLNGLDALPARGFRFLASPVKFVGSTGAQVRAFAITEDEALSRETRRHPGWFSENSANIGRSFSFALVFVVSLMLLFSL